MVFLLDSVCTVTHTLPYLALSVLLFVCLALVNGNSDDEKAGSKEWCNKLCKDLSHVLLPRMDGDFKQLNKKN